MISHGNGPQVGNLLIQHEQARDDVPAMPLDVLVSMTEGSLGYILQQSLLNELRKRDKEAIIRAGALRFDRETGAIRQ